MFRFLVFLLVVLALAILFAWVADNPGTIFLQWEWLAQKLGRPGEEVGIPLTLAVSLLVGLIFLVLLGWGVLRSVIGAPTMLSKFFDNRKREKGYKALSQGLIAASSGDASTARKLTKESKRLLGQDPLVSLLGTQTAILEGKRDEARENFKTMLEDDSTKMVALRGLFLEAERQGEPEAARHYAEEAAKSAPSLPWAGNAKLRYAASDGDWDAAIRTLDSNRSAGLIDKIAAKRQRAVLLTGKAMAKENENPDYALKLSKEAHKLARDLVPAATTFARVSTRLGDPKTATKILEASWRIAPHPELAEAHAAVSSGESVQERLERAKNLSKLVPKDPEGNLALAIAAIDATEWDQAREALEPILTTHPTERAYLLMADIEEGQHGDKGRMRDWLARAVRAPADPAWVAGNHISDEWLPVSPVDGEIDAFEWKVPVQQLGDESAPVMTLEELKAESVIEAEVEEVELEEETTDEPPIEDAMVVTDEEASDEKPSDGEEGEKPEEATAEVDDSKEEIEIEAKDEKEETSNEVLTPTEAQNDNQETPKEVVEEEASEEEHLMPNKLADQIPEDMDTAENDNTVKFPLKRRPDDPGPHPDKEPPKKGFKLF